MTLKRKWFDMILSGEKKIEYREIKYYWIKRLAKTWSAPGEIFIPFNIEQIIFTNGYAKDSPTFKIECKGITIESAKPEWSDNAQGEFFCIQLGNIITE